MPSTPRATAQTATVRAAVTHVQAPAVVPAAAIDVGDGALSLNVRCFDGRSVVVRTQSADKVAEVKVRLQDATGIHRATQRLVFAGATLKDEDTIGSTALIDGSTLFMLALKTFPATLGPFLTAGAGVAHRDFELPPLDMGDFDQQGAMWIMEQRAAARHGVRAAAGASVEFPLCGQFSPPHPVTLTDEEKQAISIPAAAKEFVFSYPVVAFDALAGGSDEVRSFLSVGGYAYLDGARRIIHTTTLLPARKDSGGLQFKGAQRWKAEWTAALMRQGRFQRITIAALNHIGAHHFCWLRPGEVITGEDGAPCAQQPQVPHGGFAYLFHREVFKAADAERALDRYFPIASGDDYVADDADDGDAGATATGEGVASFATVSHLAQLQDLVEEAASGAAEHDDGELRTRIDTLERQLDSVTKCVACLVEDKDTILMPCRHLCMCQACAGRVQRCPICRQNVASRERSFIS